MSVNIKSNVDAVIKAADTRSRMALRECGPLLLVSAIRHCPVDTGNLQRNIEVVYEGLRLHLGSKVHYAGYVEGGTEKMRAQPYLIPSLTDNLKNIKRIFRTKT